MTGKSSDNGSNSSGGGGSGNNSDNSALVSLGNTSFGFNFDCEEGMNSSPRNSNNSEEGDSDGNTNFHTNQRKANGKPGQSARPKAGKAQNPSATILPNPDPAKTTHSEAAAAAVANLQSIANASSKKQTNKESNNKSVKRKSLDTADNDSGGYNSDDEYKGARASESSRQGQDDDDEDGDGDDHEDCSVTGGQKGGRKRRKLDDMKREERNAREKERSFRISRQINELRGLLSSGGVIVPKGTKSSVLTEAANYIRMLQQHQYRSEIDRHQLVQQIQMIGGGALGQPAANAVRHVAAQNGVWSLGNFGGVPPKSAMMYHQQPSMSSVQSDGGAAMQQQQQAARDGSVLPNKIEEPDYRYVFNSCTVGMAIASMGGAFIDCNNLFCQLSNYTKQEVCSMTIFNLTARQDLQHAFDLISQMLSAPADTSSTPPSSTCVLRGALKHRTDLGLSVTLIKGEDAVAKCFCVTLVVNPVSPFDNTRPIPATIDCAYAGQQGAKNSAGMDPAPAYTTG